jgi:predicted GH43/DUF377 family glycosyl hydrolase
MNLIRSKQIINPDKSRVLAKYFALSEETRIKRIIQSLLELDEIEIQRRNHELFRCFESRHRDIKRVFKNNYNNVEKYVNSRISLDLKLLIGAHFTMEYSVESTALFNPSIVPHPDQSTLNDGELRVIVAFRAIGEGHISSIVFRAGVINNKGNIVLEENNFLIEEGTIRTSKLYDKEEFALSLMEGGLLESAQPALDELIDRFSIQELDEAVLKYAAHSSDNKKGMVVDTLKLLATTNYSLSFDPETELCSRVIFPVSTNERKGLEDSRFVSFSEEPGKRKYYATYTAFSGTAIAPQLIETYDFMNFTISTLHGPGCKNKGLALFPELIDGKYVMVSRQDNENIFIMKSENLKYWEKPILICRPEQSWEGIQLGNCGSPVKTEKGWLLLTHGVGPVRTYSIGAVLLDLKDPVKVIGKLKTPLIAPNEMERNGYVPNVVYSCGAVLHEGWLIIPYAMSDSISSFAKIKIDDLLSRIIET